MKKKFLALALTAVMALSLAACGGDTQTSGDTSTDDTASGDGQTYTVGIIQQMQHEALDAATEGFQAALTEKLGDSVTIEFENASGDPSNYSTIANNFAPRAWT